MAKSTGIVLTSTGIVLANEWYQTNKVNFRVAIAGLGVALVFSGIEKINEKAGVGLSVIMLITVLMTPINGKTPAQTVLDFTGNRDNSYKGPPRNFTPSASQGAAPSTVVPGYGHY